MTAPEPPFDSTAEPDAAATRPWESSVHNGPVSSGGTPETTLPVHPPEGLPGQAGRYQLLEEIGRGGMGVICRAHDPDMRRSLAVKVMLAPAAAADLQRRFLEEARV